MRQIEHVISELARANRKIAEVEFDITKSSVNLNQINELNQAETIVANCIKQIANSGLDLVVHSKWDSNGRCVKCGGRAPFLGLVSANYYKSPYCPNCGAHMKDGE